MDAASFESLYLAEKAARLKAEAERDAAIAQRDSAIAERDAAFAKGEELTQKCDELQEDLDEAREQAQSLGKDLAILKHSINSRLYGRRSERDAQGQLFLAFAAEVEGDDALILVTPAADGAGDDDEVHEGAETPERRSRGKRSIVTSHLRREERVYEISKEELDSRFGVDGWKEIKPETREELEHRPGELFVVLHVTKKYVATKCSTGPVRAPSPKAVISKALPGPGLLAHLIVSKYDFHLPLFRQARIFAHQGVHFPRSTMCSWLGQCLHLLQGIIATLKRELLARGVIGMDDTPITLLDPEAPGGSRKSFMWPFVGDDGTIVYLWTRGRGRDGPSEFLAEFHGYLHGDFAAVNLSLAGDDIVFVGCWAHARRRFNEAQTSYPVECTHAKALIRRLYRIETEIRGRSHEEIRQYRQTKSVPILDELERWGKAQRSKAMPSSALGAALSYMLDHFDMLRRYVDDGRLPIDNNGVERQVRPVAVGRKNYMFYGGKRGGEMAAAFYTLIANCRIHGVDATSYLADVLARVPTSNGAELAQLTPKRWKELQLPAPAAMDAEPAIAGPLYA